MLSPELIKKVDQIFIRSRRKVTDIFSGEFESAIRGRGIEFEEFREYAPGDDIRQIAWNVTARMDRPFVKVFREEREQTIFFLIDLSKSQDFGSGRTKRDIVTEIAALLAYATIKSNDKIGLVLFTDRIEKYVAPKKGRAHVWHIIATVLSHKPQGKGTKIADAMQFFMGMTPRRTTCFLMSDFWDEGYEAALSIASVKHDLIVLRVLDEIEKGFPQGALIDFIDNEEDHRVSADLFSSSQRKHIQKELFGREEKLQHFFRSKRVDELNLLVGEDYAEALLNFFIRREKKR